MNRIWTVITVLLWLGGLGLIWLTRSAGIRGLAQILCATYFMSWGVVFLLSSLPRREINQRFALMTGTLFIVLVLLESAGLLGIVDYRIVFSTPELDPIYSPYNVLDPEILHLRRPYYRHVVSVRTGNLAVPFCRRGEPIQPYEIATDRFGFRNLSDRDRADIAVIGDSIVEGSEVPQRALLTSELGRLQQRTVQNLGQSNFGPQQELAVLKRYALPLQPKVVVWVFFEGNDLGDILVYEDVKAKWAELLSLLPWRRSFSNNLLMAVLRVSSGCQLPFSDVPPHIHSGHLRSADGKLPVMYFFFPGRPLEQKDLNSLKKFDAMIAEASEVLRAQGAQLLVVFAPTKFRVYQGLIDFAPDSDARNWTVNDLPKRLGEQVKEIPGVTYLDLTPILRQAAEAGQIVYFPDDTHWNEEGHRLAAEAIHSGLGLGAARAQITTP